MRILICLIMVLICRAPVLAAAGDRDFRLDAPAALVESGLMKHLLPRFSLKTNIRVTLVEGGAAEVVLRPDGEGVPVFSGAGAVWHLQVARDHDGAVRFADWLTSQVGQRAITGFEVAGVAPFGLPEAQEAPRQAAGFDGDAAQGLALSVRHCGRCHVVSEKNRMNIGSTPSFHVLRTLRDWDTRFQAFFALNPHPSFTQIKGVTEPFPVDRPSPIAPVEMTLDELDAVLAYVSRLAPADLGAPIQHQ